MNHDLYAYSPIVERPRLQWPGGARVAFYIGLNIEHYHVDKPATSATPTTVGLVPDPMNYGWRDYGVRVGIWRLIELLDRVGMVPSVMLNSEVCHHYPQIVQAGRDRGWAWLAHGQNNSTLHTGFGGDEERAYLTEMVQTIASATGSAPRGWLGPAMTETFDTPRLLAELGLTYVLDWCNDDQPFPLSVDGMIAVPYSVELNDITLCVGRNLSGEAYVRWVIDTLDQLLADGESTGRVMALPIHPFVINQPSRHRYLARVLEEVAARDGVWVTTSDEIARHYLSA
ncbi:MAG: polysaccharide deacetylase [Solirubrobacterales bacterium]|nr:polysaccharide deacetylase [Solirubrobacterales bacterium]